MSLDAASAIDIFPVSVTSNAPAHFPLGTTMVIWRAVDANGNVSEGAQAVLVQDTTAPELSVPASIVMEGNQRGGAEVVVDEASAQDGVDDNPVVSCDAESGNFPVGETVVSCQATDFAGNRSMETFTVTVVDTTAPELTASSSTTSLSPPNHKYVHIDMTIAATDIVDEALMLTAMAVSSESDNGDDDGNTTGDILVTTAAGGEVASSIFEPVVSFLPRSDSLRLRAERNGEGNGRTYTIVITAADAAGNTAESTIEISVPVGQSGNGKSGNKKHDKKKDEKKGKGVGK